MAASELVNLSLDDIIARQNRFKKFGGSSRGRGRGGARGGGIGRGNFRGRQIPTVVNAVQRQRTYSGQGGRFGSEKLCTVQIANLGPMVTTRDLQELFAQHPYVDIAVHYDQRGNSRGTAVVLFKTFDEAMHLKREFTGVKLDGRLMELFAVSNTPSARANRLLQPTSNFGPQRGRVTKFRRKSGGFVLPGKRDSFGGFRPPAGGRGGKKVPAARMKMSADELDRELDAYMRASKHTRVAAP